MLPIIILVTNPSITLAQFTPIVELSGLNGKDGLILNGVNATDYSGIHLNNLGDINNDGIDDIIIGAPGSDTNGNNSGSIYVVLG